ncbi:MAG: ComF family protein [Bacteroidota bacterium]
MNLFKTINTLLFPPLCLACTYPLTSNEVLVCTQCRHQLPLTHIHTDDADTVAKVFYGRVKIAKATALFWFEKQSIVQHLIHQLKYKGHQEIGTLLGNWLGAELCKTAHYSTVDVVIPVPLHPRKQRQRGYNQVSTFGLALAAHLNALYLEDVLIKTQHTKTQTYKTRLLRWNTIKERFAIRHRDAIANRHILLVDDVITTGATLEACAHTLLCVENVKISIAAMAIVA